MVYACMVRGMQDLCHTYKMTKFVTFWGIVTIFGNCSGYTINAEYGYTANILNCLYKLFYENVRHWHTDCTLYYRASGNINQNIPDH